MIGEPWMLPTVAGLLLFLMLLPLLKALLPLPHSRPRRRIHLERRQRLARRIEPHLAENAPQQLDARQ